MPAGDAPRPIGFEHPIGRECCFVLTVDDAGTRLEDDGRRAVERALAAIHDGRELLDAILTLQDLAAFLERDDESAEAAATIAMIANAATPRCELLLARHRARTDRSAQRLIGALPLRARHVGSPPPAGSFRVAALAVPAGKLR